MTNIKVNKNTVKLSATVGDEYPRQKVSDAVKRSGLTLEQKRTIWAEVSQGFLTKPNADVVRKILQAENTGGTYIPPIAGQL